jgi:hypothetical protein
MIAARVVVARVYTVFPGQEQITEPFGVHSIIRSSELIGWFDHLANSSSLPESAAG